MYLIDTNKFVYNKVGFYELPLITNTFESMVVFNILYTFFLGNNKQKPGYTKQLISFCAEK
jgi:hypothetical protein